MTTTPITGATLTEEGANNVPVVNTALLRIEWLAAPVFQTMDSNTPPGSPSNGQAWFTGSSPTGDWADQGSKIAFYYDGWAFWDPIGGIHVYNTDTDELMGYSSVESEWYPVRRRWSTTEHWTGEYREDSSGTAHKIYSKVVYFGTLPATSTKSVSHGITNLSYDVPVGYQASAYNDSVQHFPMPVITQTALCTLFIQDAQIQCQSNANFSSYSMAIRLEYAKHA